MTRESLANIRAAALRAADTINCTLAAHGDTPRDVHIALALALDALESAVEAADAIRAEMDADI